MALMVRAVSTVDKLNWRCTRISGGDASKRRGGGWLAILHAIRCRFGVRISVGVYANTHMSAGFFILTSGDPGAARARVMIREHSLFPVRYARRLRLRLLHFWFASGRMTCSLQFAYLREAAQSLSNNELILG